MESNNANLLLENEMTAFDNLVQACQAANQEQKNTAAAVINNWQDLEAYIDSKPALAAKELDVAKIFDSATEAVSWLKKNVSEPFDTRAVYFELLCSGNATITTATGQKFVAYV
jgi:hypothetical protein